MTEIQTSNKPVANSIETKGLLSKYMVWYHSSLRTTTKGHKDISACFAHIAIVWFFFDWELCGSPPQKKKPVSDDRSLSVMIQNLILKSKKTHTHTFQTLVGAGKRSGCFYSCCRKAIAYSGTPWDVRTVLQINPLSGLWLLLLSFTTVQNIRCWINKGWLKINETSSGTRPNCTTEPIWRTLFKNKTWKACSWV